MENKEISIEKGFPIKSLRVLIEKSDIIESICNNSIVNVQDDENTEIISDFLTFENTQKPDLEIETTEFIIEENDALNISPNLSEPGADPLAIDEFNIAEIATPNIINDSQFSLPKENVIYIVDVDDIKENSGDEKPAINKIKVRSLENIHGKNGEHIFGNNYGSTKNSFRHKTSTITQSTLGANSSDENETPSDGSDSGLGLESSVLQIDCSDSSSVGIRRPLKSSLKRKSGTLTTVPPNKRGKKSIQFDNVKIFYFPRIQGFCCVPSQGGCTLGMGAKHVHTKTYKLNEHANLKKGDDKITMQLCTAKGSSSDETDSDEDLSEENISDFDPDSSGFLQPVPVKTRRAILKAAGIKKIDSTEKDECRAIRSSREYCGCLCRGFCDPDTCSCSQGGIKCQVDRPNFPCGCSRDGCGNINGRIEFNPGRVRTHFIHTIMRLEIENKSKTTFLQETQGYFKNSNPTDIHFETDTRNLLHNGMQFFPDSISNTIANDHNYDLYATHNSTTNNRSTLLPCSSSDYDTTDDLSYPTLKPFLIPNNSFNYHQHQLDEHKNSNIPNNFIKDSITNCVIDYTEATSTVSEHLTSNHFDSFSSAYTNFLKNCETSYNNSVNEDDYLNIISNNSEYDTKNTNFNQCTIDTDTPKELLNSNIINELPISPVASSTPENSIHKKQQSENINLESDSINSSLGTENIAAHNTQLCTLASSAQTSTSISEGTSTNVVSKYVSSPSKKDSQKDVQNLSNNSNNSPINQNNIKIQQINNEVLEVTYDQNKENNIIGGIKEECIATKEISKDDSSCTSKENPISTNKLTTNNDYLDSKNEVKKQQYQLFNLTSNNNNNLPFSISNNSNSNDDINNRNLFNVPPSSTSLDLLKNIQ